MKILLLLFVWTATAAIPYRIVKNLMDAAECQKVIDYIETNVDDDPRITSPVDSHTEFAAWMNTGHIIDLFGMADALKVAQVPKLIEPEAHLGEFSCFGRRFNNSTRADIKLHTDLNAWTMNVALNNHSEYDGGDLIYKQPGEDLHNLQREAGEAFVYAHTVEHGVLPVTSGSRYSLLCFYWERGQQKNTHRRKRPE